MFPGEKMQKMVIFSFWSLLGGAETEEQTEVDFFVKFFSKNRLGLVKIEISFACVKIMRILGENVSLAHGYSS